MITDPINVKEHKETLTTHNFVTMGQPSLPLHLIISQIRRRLIIDRIRQNMRFSDNGGLAFAAAKLQLLAWANYVNGDTIIHIE